MVQYLFLVAFIYVPADSHCHRSCRHGDLDAGKIREYDIPRVSQGQWGSHFGVSPGDRLFDYRYRASRQES